MPRICGTFGIAALAMPSGCTGLHPIAMSDPATRKYDYVYVVDIPRGFAAKAAAAFSQCGLIALSQPEAGQLRSGDRNRLLYCSMTASRSLDDLVESTVVMETTVGRGITQRTTDTTPSMSKITVNITMVDASGKAIYRSRGEYVGEKGQALAAQSAAIDLALERITAECVGTPSR